MKKSILFACMMVATIIFCSSAFAQRNKKQAKETQPAPQPAAVVTPPPPMFSNRMDTISYILGADIAKSFIKNEMKINQDKLFKGFRDGMAKKDTIFTEAQISNIMKAYQEEMMKIMQDKADAEVKKAQDASKAFLAQNKTKEGITELPSGVQYKILKEGTGPFPQETDSVTVHYKGTLIDGTVFDSSIDRGEPVTFPLNQVIKGWTEGMQKCKLGGKIQLFIPSDLAYGDKTTGPIPGGSALIFEVELLKIKAAAPEPEPAKETKAAPAKKAPAKAAPKTAAKKTATTKTTAKPAVK
ncbi:MAG: FKBP-type peptidyl-prolyl cis-trans isomerase [Bacteroidota bacterium]|nr:FKBP-type peptidyl-prolyl cis-trans isomerase [Bacteroidota bacterium]